MGNFAIIAKSKVTGPVIMANSISPIKQTVLPAMTPTVIKAKYKGLQDPQATYVANIWAPRTLMVSGVPSIISIDEHNICHIVVQNCAQLDRDDILGIMEIEDEQLVPLTDDFISSVCQDIHDRFPKVKK